MSVTTWNICHNFIRTPQAWGFRWLIFSVCFLQLDSFCKFLASPNSSSNAFIFFLKGICDIRQVKISWSGLKGAEGDSTVEKSKILKTFLLWGSWHHMQTNLAFVGLTIQSLLTLDFLCSVLTPNPTRFMTFSANKYNFY